VVARAIVPWLFGAATLADAAAFERTVRGFAAMQGQVPAATLARQAAGLRAWSGTRGADLARIGVPALVVEAAGDLLTLDAAAVAASIPGATRTVVPGAGHAVMLEAPDAVTAAIDRHVRGAAAEGAPPTG
jgi:pimeloyl-ACP methyl ester carboxylesterase